MLSRYLAFPENRDGVHQPSGKVAFVLDYVPYFEVRANLRLVRRQRNLNHGILHLVHHIFVFENSERSLLPTLLPRVTGASRRVGAWGAATMEKSQNSQIFGGKSRVQKATTFDAKDVRGTPSTHARDVRGDVPKPRCRVPPPPLREEEEEEEEEEGKEVEANLARTGSRRKTTAWCAPRLFRLPWGQPVPARQAETALHGVHRLPPRQGKEQVCGVQPREAEVPSREGQERLQGVREIRKGQAERTFRFIGKRARSGGQAQAHVNHANREYVLYFPNPADCFPTQD